MFELIELLNAIKKMTPELKAYLLRELKPFFFKKGHTILNIGEVHDHILYIQKGVVQCYYHNRNKKKVTNWFMKEKDIFISVVSFFDRVPSEEILVAYEDCTCFGISHDMLDKICEEMPEFQDHRIKITEIYYSMSMKRESMFKRLNGSAIFEMMMEQSPDLVARVKSVDLASYLGVDPRTITRWRDQYHKKNGGARPKKNKKNPK